MWPRSAQTQSGVYSLLTRRMSTGARASSSSCTHAVLPLTQLASSGVAPLARARARSALALSRSRVHSTSPFEALTKSSDVSPLAALTSACASTSMSAHLTCPFAIATKSGVAPSWVVHQRTSAPDHKSSFTQSRWPF